MYHNGYMKKILVVYHADCPDGFGAAWAAWKKFGNKAEYVAVPPRVLPKVPLRGRSAIYILDTSCSRTILEKLVRENKWVVVIDHHKTSESDVKSTPEHVFDLK